MLLIRAWLLSVILTASALAGDVYEPKPGSQERTAIMEALRGPVSKHVGKRVTFTGRVGVDGTWAVFNGDAAPTDGKPPKGDVADELELDLFALLQKRDGAWVVLHWGFAGDIGVMEEAKQKFPKAPREVFNLPPK